MGGGHQHDELGRAHEPGVEHVLVSPGTLRGGDLVGRLRAVGPGVEDPVRFQEVDQSGDGRGRVHALVGERRRSPLDEREFLLAALGRGGPEQPVGQVARVHAGMEQVSVQRLPCPFKDAFEGLGDLRFSSR